MYLLFDIGATKTRIAVSLDGETIGDPKIFPTAKEFEEGVRTLTEDTRQLTAGKKVLALAGSITGPLDKKKTKSVNPPNMPSWKDKPLKKDLEKAFEAPVYLENDAALVGLGEAMFGAGAGERIVAYITASTGIGGARIVDGQIDENALGFEPGHQVIDYESNLVCGCGGKGHLEAFIGGGSLERRFGKKPEDNNDDEVWDEAARILAVGLNNTIVHWSPDIVILGGSLMNKIELKKVQNYLNQILTIFPTPPRVVRATLGDIGGLYGALAYAKTKR